MTRLIKIKVCPRCDRRAFPDALVKALFFCLMCGETAQYIELEMEA